MNVTKKIALTVSIITVMSLTAGTALADWDPGDPAKWVQLPDLTPEGMDVKATVPKILADDFLCTTPEPITDIHIWGSWLFDQLPPGSDGTGGDPGNVNFRLSIHSDIPAVIGPGGVVEEHSRPGDLLWLKDFSPGEFAVREYATVTPGEGWYDPNTGEFIWPADNVVWQYNFLINPTEAFPQQGTATDPVVYWLDVSAATPDNQLYQFGWKTSQEHWNDDGVWRDILNPNWNELRYPSAHPFAGQSMDLAFVITPEPATMLVLALGGLASLIRRSRKA